MFMYAIAKGTRIIFSINFFEPKAALQGTLQKGVPISILTKENKGAV